jgi:hypothetical protein
VPSQQTIKRFIEFNLYASEGIGAIRLAVATTVYRINSEIKGKKVNFSPDQYSRSNIPQIATNYHSDRLTGQLGKPPQNFCLSFPGNHLRLLGIQLGNLVFNIEKPMLELETNRSVLLEQPVFQLLQELKKSKQELK